MDRRHVARHKEVPAQTGDLSRRTLIQGAAATGLGAVTGALTWPGGRVAQAASLPAAGLERADAPAQGAETLFQELDAKVEGAMTEYRIPGVAVAVYFQGQEHVRGYGVTNVDYPQPVDGDTVFRIGSVTKTFTATTVMRLVDQGRLALDAPVRTYLPDLRLADEMVAARMTVRQLLNHSAGWLGEYYPDFGRGADALAKYTAGLEQLPQMTPLGEVFAYNNASVVLAGRVIEAVADMPYEDAVHLELLAPLGLDHTFFFSDEIVGFNVAASHALIEGAPSVQPALWPLWRSLHPTGGLIASARDLLRYARFHLGPLPATDGPPILSPAALRAMRSPLGPPGTYTFEIDGVGVNWMRRPTAEGVHVVQWDGDWPGQHSGFAFVPERGFALAVLTNATSGTLLRTDLLDGDWALERFAGLHNRPAVPRTLTPAQLAPYEGDYWAQAIAPPPGDAEETAITMRADGGRLHARLVAGDAPAVEGTFAFYRDDHIVALYADGRPTPGRSDFVRGPDGRVAWFRFGGRLHRRLD
jgi:CubicO group peptidase (beta-lactamase class C family)